MDKTDVPRHVVLRQGPKGRPQAALLVSERCRFIMAASGWPRGQHGGRAVCSASLRVCTVPGLGTGSWQGSITRQGQGPAGQLWLRFTIHRHH